MYCKNSSKNCVTIFMSESDIVMTVINCNSCQLAPQPVLLVLYGLIVSIQ